MNQAYRAPFLHDSLRVADYQKYQLWALSPAMLWGCLRYNWQAVLVIAVALVAAVATDWITSRANKTQPAVLQALLIGLLIAACMPPEVALYIPAVAAICAIVLGYALLGGQGSNWLHPAALGLLVVIVSWPNAFSPIGFHLSDGSPVLSPLSTWYAVLSNAPVPGQTPSDLLSGLSQSVRPDLTAPFLSWLHGSVHLPVPDHLIAGFLGFGYGAIGLSSPVLLLIGSVVLFGSGLGDWRPSAAAFGVFVVLTWGLAGLAWGLDLGRGDVLFYMVNGSLLLVLCFMMHHTTTLPPSTGGRLCYGLLLGFVLWVVLIFGRLELGAVVALVFANLWVPLIVAGFRNRLRRRFGLS